MQTCAMAWEIFFKSKKLLKDVKANISRGVAIDAIVRYTFMYFTCFIMIKILKYPLLLWEGKWVNFLN